MGRIRVVRLAQPLVLGVAPAPAVHPARAAGRVRAHRRKGRRTRNPRRHSRGHARAGAAGPDDIIADKGYYGQGFEAELAAAGITLLRPARKGEKPRPGQHLLKPLRQVIESINSTFKTQLDLEAHGGRTAAGVTVRVLQRILALTAAIWHNQNTGNRPLRSLIAYDH